MKKLCTLFAVLLTASVAVGQNPYQLKSLQGSTRDVTTETTTTNAWKYVNGMCNLTAGSVSVAIDSLWCISGGDADIIYKFNRTTRAWDRQTAMGNNMKVLAVQNSGNVYALGLAGSCLGQYGIFFWNGSAWTQRTGCYIKLSVGPNGNLRAINNTNQLWLSSDGGNSWPTEADGWKWSQEAGGNFGCSIDANNGLWATISGSPSEPLPAIPSGTVAGCLYASMPDVAVAWNTAGSVYAMPLENWGTWQVVTGISATQISGMYRGLIFGEDSQSKVYHWNINAPTISATFGGQWSVGLGCPDHSHPCNSSTTHKVSHDMNFTSGHGLLGGHKELTDLFTHDIEVPNLVYNPSCDPFFGQQADPECVAEIGGVAFCNESHADVQNVNFNYVVQDSTDVMEFNFNDSSNGPMNVHTGLNAGYYLGEVINDVKEACYVNDPVPQCPAISPADIYIRASWWGSPADQARAQNEWYWFANHSKAGLDSPYVYDSFFLAQQLPDGSLINVYCFGDPHLPNDFLDGNFEARPHCK